MSAVYSSLFEPFEPRGRSLMEVHPRDDGADDDNLASSILSSSPRLANKSPSCFIQAIKVDEYWTVRAVPCGEEELYAKGRCAYWTRNSLIVKSFNFTDQVVKIFWSQFKKADHICVALSSGLSIFNRTGQHFQIPLPFAYQEIHPTRMGVIIERNCDLLEDTSLPVLFSLTHPTSEISPILFKLHSKAYKTLSYSLPSSLSIVGCHETLPLCLIYNSQECQHSIWRVRSTTEDEVDEFQRMNEDSTATGFGNNQSSSSFRDGISQASLNISTRQRSGILHSAHAGSSTTFSPKMDMRSKHSILGSLAASRLGVGGGQMTPDTNTSNIKSFNSTHTINMMSTPNRNRIINYLRDNIEEPIMPELTIEQVWSENSTNSLKASKFFKTTDISDKDYLVIVTAPASQIKVIHCEFNDKACDDVNFGQSGTISAIDAMPIDEMKMMLVLDVNKNFSLYTGIDHVTTLSMPQNIIPNTRPPQSSSSPASKMNMDMTPVQMSSARKRSSFADRNSSIASDVSMNQMFQALSPVPYLNKNEAIKSSPIMLGDAKSIENVVRNRVYIRTTGNQRARFEIPSVCQTLCVKRLLDAMEMTVSKELGLLLMTKWYQQRRSACQPSLMHARDEMHLFKNWFLSCLSITSSFFDSDELPRTYDIALRFAPHSPAKRARKTRETETNPILANVYSLFYSMHLVFEDLLLSKTSRNDAYDLVELLLVLACLLRLSDYQDYYWLKFPQFKDKFGPHKSQLETLLGKTDSIQKPAFFETEPPSVMDFLSKLVAKSRIEHKYCEEEVLHSYPNLMNVTQNSRTVISLFCEMFSLDRSRAIFDLSSSSTQQTYNVLSKKPTRSKAADESVVELMVEFGKDRNFISYLPEGISLYLWDSILNCRESPPIDWNDACFELIGRMDLVNLVRGRAQAANNSESRKIDDEDDVLKLIFPDDTRVSEAHRMLTSDSPVEFIVTQRQGSTDDETRDETHKQLYLLNIRTMAMPIGRGALNLRTYSPIIGESFEVPRLELSGRPLSEDRPVEYNHDSSVYPWPFFHNGVAAGLTICASTANNIIDSTWINYNRPRSNMPHGTDMRDRDLTTTNINNEHAGFLFALGLNGHLEKLSLMGLHDYLCQNNDLTKLAILLGMSASKRGSRDNNIIKVLSIHVDALLPPNSTELDVPAPVHAAAIIGVGLLYQSSGDSHISKVLLEEIGRLPGPEANSHVDRESYALAAGLSFGLVNLCRGGASTITSSDQLRLYMLGGKRKPLNAVQKDRYFKQDCHRGEEEYINTHITSPGGTLGLGLMYHRSGNQSVANWMRAPDTQTLLEYVRPDFLILRMISYGLIMWNNIEPTENWINSNIPKIVSANAFQRNSSSESETLIATGIGSGAIDYELISQAYCNIVAGSCMAIALRYAGTADNNAYKTIYKHTKMLIALSNKPALVDQAGKPCVEACLNVLVTSLAVVMAGTGDLGVLRVCRYLRSRLTQSCVLYGSYMAVHLALGILFLGSCRYSLSSSPESIGALICALYPIYPNHCSDNRYHLQALRHLYVLAAEPRILIPRDIQTQKPVYVDITVRQCKQSGQITILKLKAPCLMPETDSIESVLIDDERYWRIEIKNKACLDRCLFKDRGHLSVKQKAHSSNNQLVQDIETYILQNLPEGKQKSRKTSALAECVNEDRVEQYSALNELLTNSCHIDNRYKSLLLEQLRLACSLAGGKLESKMNLLKATVGEFEDELMKEGDLFESWRKYLSRATDWTSTNLSVAQYITINDLKYSRAGGELLHKLKELSFDFSDD